MRAHRSGQAASIDQRSARARASVKLGDVTQSHIASFLRTLGGKVYVFGTRRSKGGPCPHCRQFVPNTDHGTHQTPGVADVLAFLPAPPPGRATQILGGPIRRRVALWVESMAGAGRLSPEQREFRDFCLDAAQDHVVGDLDAVIAWALAHGYLVAGQVPHYRLPKEA